jgi:hypothetical protein
MPPRISHQKRIIDSDAVNDPCSIANTAVPAEFARCLLGLRLIMSHGASRNLLFTGLPLVGLVTLFI